MTTPPLKFVAPSLHDNNGLIEAGKNHRWYIQYGFWNELGNYVRRRSFKINRFKTAQERYSYAKQRIEALTKELHQIEVEEKKKQMSVLTAFEEVLVLKKPLLRERSYLSFSATAHHFVGSIFLESVPIRELDDSHILAYQDLLIREGKCPKTINGYMSYLRAMLGEMEKRGWVLEQPFKKISKLKEGKSYRNRAFNDTELQLLKSYISQDAMLEFSVMLMYYCFIRPNEIRSIQVKHFNTQHQQLLIPSLVSKNKKTEFVSLPSALQTHLNRFVKNKPGNEYIFSTDGGKTPIGRNTLTARHRKIVEQLNLDKNCTFYSWKHTGVVTAYKEGVDIKSIQLQCRHYSLEMTDIYLKSMGLYINKAILNKMPEW